MLLITKTSSFHVIAKALIQASKPLLMKINTTIYTVNIENTESNLYNAVSETLKVEDNFKFHVLDGYLRSTDKTITVASPEIQFFTGE